VRDREPLGDHGQEVDDIGNRDRHPTRAGIGNPLLERLADEPIHDEKRRPFVLADRVNLDEEGAPKCGKSPALDLERRGMERSSRGLERDAPVQPLVDRVVHDAHSSGPEDAGDRVGASHDLAHAKRPGPERGGGAGRGLRGPEVDDRVHHGVPPGPHTTQAAFPHALAAFVLIPAHRLRLEEPPAPVQDRRVEIQLAR
jgi:hypothetical protein